MKASAAKPEYSVYIVSGSTKYNITPAVDQIDFSDQENEFAQRVTIQVGNVQVGDSRLSDLLSVRNRVYIHADDGTTEGEVYRGFLWDMNNKNSLTSKALQLKCYDNLIYFQESDESVYFSSGKSTESVCSSLCDSWGVKLEYTYESITHSKLALRGYLADIFTDDILPLVKDRTGKKYVIRSEKDVMKIMGVGENTTIYHFKAKKNVTQTSSSCTMDGVVTKVVILGKADKNDREPVEATVSGDTAKYGTLQKTINRDENTTLTDSKKEAQSIIDEDGEPKWKYQLKAVDVPWIRKGDKIYADAGDLSGYYIVTGVDRTITRKNRELVLELEKP